MDLSVVNGSSVTAQTRGSEEKSAGLPLYTSSHRFNRRMSVPPNAVASSSTHKSHKKHKSSKDKNRKDTGKSKEKSEKTGPFEHRTSRLRLSIPPKYGGDYLAGIKDILNGMLMR